MADPKYQNVGDPFDRLQEECAEVIVAISKIKRFGLNNRHPLSGKHNSQALVDEMKDVQSAWDAIIAQYGARLT